MLRQLSFLILALAFCLTLSAQTFEETEYVVVDRGTQMNGSDGELRLYTHSGGLLSTLTSAGSGQFRGAAFANNGDLYVARGDDILRYTGSALTPDAMPFFAGTKAQDIVINPADDHIWCAFGNNAGSSMIMEFDDTGTMLQLITDPLLVHPRSIAINFAGDTIFIANQAGGNVLALDVATGVLVEHVNIAASISSFGPIGITVPRDQSNLIYVVSDYGSGPTQIVEVAGASGSTTTTLFLDFGSLTDMTSPAGVHADNYGNLFLAGRSKNSGVPGIYVYNRAVAQRPVLPYIGSENISPIDITFRKTMLRLTLTSSDGVSVNTGLPRVLSGVHNTQVIIDMEAPDYPGMPYAILYSLMTDTVCSASLAEPLRPLGGGIPFQLPDSRTSPLLVDEFFFQSIGLIQAGGTGAPVILNPADCPGTTPGFFLHPQGVITPAGTAQAILTMPSLPCLPPGFVAYMAFNLVVIDMQTLPTLVGASTSNLVCLALEGP